jgi:hypothetical protein
MRRLILFLMLGWAALAVFVTTQPGSTPLVQFLNRTLAQSSLGGAIGHGGLFAMLTGISYLGWRGWCSRPLALGLAMLGALLAGTGTEFYQFMVDGRNATLIDLLANWLGVFMVGFGLVCGMGMFPEVGKPSGAE